MSQMNITTCFDSNTNEDMVPIKEGVNAFSLFGSNTANSDDVLKNIQGLKIEQDEMSTPVKLRTLMLPSSNKRLRPAKNARQFSPVRSFDIEAEVSSQDKSSQK